MPTTRALLLFNPVSGTNVAARDAVVQRVATVLRGFGYDLLVAATTGRGSAGDQARLAAEGGAEVVFVCGGDGTIHDALQGLVGTGARLAPLPMGSGNALCRELGLPLNPLRAAAAYGRVTERDVRVGECTTGDGSCRFLLMAGAGPDGALMYRMLTAGRGRLGRWAYGLHALRLLFRGRFHTFAVRYRTADGAWHQEQVLSAMALRIGSLGGVFPGVARGASLHAATMRLVLVRSPAVISLPLWFVSSWLRMERWNPFLVRDDVLEFACDGDGVHAQVDGEWVGRLPMRASLQEETVRVLVPDVSLAFGEAWLARVVPDAL